MNAPQHSHTPFAIRPYAAGDQDAVVALWQRCGLTLSPPTQEHADGI